MSELMQGTPIRELVMVNEKNIKRVGENNIIRMSVQMETGQCAYVPWAKISYEDGSYRLVNLAHATTVIPEASK